VRTWGRLFLALVVFAEGLGTVYYVVSDHEWAGSVLLWTLGLMPAIVWLYAARRGAFRQAMAQDDPAADPSAGAGEDLGSFPSRTIWPVFLALGVIVTGAAFVYGLILLPLGIAIGWSAVVGLMRESRG
jgi:Cytochrome c oxidase subunit IV